MGTCSRCGAEEVALDGDDLCNDCMNDGEEQ